MERIFDSNMFSNCTKEELMKIYIGLKEVENSGLRTKTLDPYLDKAKEKICPVKLNASDIKGLYRLIVEEYNKEVQRRFFEG